MTPSHNKLVQMTQQYMACQTADCQIHRGLCCPNLSAHPWKLIATSDLPLTNLEWGGGGMAKFPNPIAVLHPAFCQHILKCALGCVPCI